MYYCFFLILLQSTIMKKIERLFSEYSESHNDAVNKRIHLIFVPLSFFAIMGIISILPSPHFYLKNFGLISVVSFFSILLVAFYYVTLSWRIAIIMLTIMMILQFLISIINAQFGHLSGILFLILVVISWGSLFYGHHVEGKKPSFLKDLQFLLIAPIWLLHFVMNKYGLKY